MATVIDEFIVNYLFRFSQADLDRMQRGVERVRRNLETAASRAESVSRVFGIMGAAIVGAGTLATRQFNQFEDSLAKIEGLVGVDTAQLRDMEDAIYRIGPATGVGPQSLSEALFRITSNGLRAAAATETLERSATAQAIGLGEAAVSANLATSAINAYGQENLSATKVYDDLTAAIRLGNLETDQLAGAMGRAIPVASAMGVEFNEVAGLLAALSRTGTDANEGVTQLTQIMASLLDPSAEGAKAMEEFGLSATAVRQSIRDEGLLDTLIGLQHRFGDNEEAMTAVFGNIRALRGVLDLLGPNLTVTQEIMADMNDTVGELDGAFQRSNTSGRRWRQTMSLAQVSLIRIGNALKPVVAQIIGPLASGLEWLSSQLEDNEGRMGQLVRVGFILGGVMVGLGGALFGVALMARLLAFTLGPVMVGYRALVALTGFLTSGTLILRAQLFALAVQQRAVALWSGIVSLATTVWTGAQWLLNAALTANPIGLVIVAIGALIGAVVLVIRYWDQVTAAVGWFWQKLQDVANGMPGWLSFVLAIFAPFIGIPLLIIRNWDTVREFFVWLWGKIGGIFRAGWAKVKPIVDAAKSVGSFFGIGGGLDDGTGGAIPGAGGGGGGLTPSLAGAGTGGAFATATPTGGFPGLQSPLPVAQYPTVPAGGIGGPVTREYNIDVGGITIQAQNVDSDEIGANVSRVVRDQVQSAIADLDDDIDR